MSVDSLGQTKEDCESERDDMLIWFEEQALFKRIAERLDKEYDLILDPDSVEDVIKVYRDELQTSGEKE